MKCKSCAAEIEAASVTCSYCGSAVVVDKRVVDDGQSSAAAPFDQIKASPEYAQRESPERLARLPKLPQIQQILPVIVLAFMAIVPIGMIGVMLVAGIGLGFFGMQVGGLMGGGMSMIPLLLIFPIGFLILVGFIAKKMFFKMKQFRESPTESCAAILIAKRTQVSGGSGDSSASTHYFLTFETEDGRRQEYSLMLNTLYGQLTEGDAGVLFIRSEIAVDFDRVG